ncbi:MAG: metallophosphoesterase [Patescibacteria group bacterium]|nr:metallophosphoesterase [Patescibacteria group bacterium]
MKIFYTTDLHGKVWKYEAIVNLLKDIKIDLAIIGADILPNRCTVTKTKRFITEYLSKFFQRIKIPIIIDFGNDDFYMFYDLFKKCVNKYNHVHISHMKEVVIKDCSIIGMHYVPDYPFGIKDWCRSEKEYLMDPYQISVPVKTINGRVEDIKDLRKYFKCLLMIEEYLFRLPKPNCKKVIYNIHCPPRTLGFDICGNGNEEVGSYAITKFIKNKKPLLTLHGHIHESSQYSGLTINKLIPETVSIQPGQLHGFTYCTFDLDNVEKTYLRTTIPLSNTNG